MKIKSKSIFVILFSNMIQCIEFDRNLFGVEYQAYVKSKENGKEVPMSHYTLQNLKTMLQVVSTKFTRIYISNLQMPDVSYVKNHTYYNTGDIMTRTAEAAALINAERKNKSLTVLIGVDLFHRTRKKAPESQLQLAVEAAQISNSIYPETVTGIQLMSFTAWEYVTAYSTLSWIQKLRTMTAHLRLKNGVRLCDRCMKATQGLRAEEMDNVRSFTNQIILNSDFIGYDYGPVDEKRVFDVHYDFSRISRNVTKFKNRILQINNNIEFMWHTRSYSSHKDFKRYWEKANKYAIEKNISVWLETAFDIPRYQYKGWWKLERNEFINNVSGYTENYSVDNVGDSFIPALNAEIPTRATITPTSTSSWGINSYIIVAVIVLAGSFASFVMTYFIFVHCRKSSSSQILSRQEISEFKFGHPVSSNAVEGEEDFDLQSDIPALHVPYDVSLETPKARIDILWDERLGRGEFGLVYKAILWNREGRDKEVAVKLPKQDSITVSLKGLLSEIKILAYLGQHSNIVSICGSYTAELDKGMVFLVLELCPLGSLKNYLKKLKAGENGRYEFSVPSPSSANGQGNKVAPNVLVELIRWSIDIACGMEHLEMKNVLHADLATRNVLLTTDKTAKITDFGLSKRLYEYSNYKKRSQAPLPWRWLPLESLRNHEFSVKSDVWSYGVTLWEIFSFGDLPFPERSWNDEFMQDMKNGLRLNKPNCAPDIMYNLMKSCWNLSANKRPSFIELQAQTSRVLEEEVAKLRDFGGGLYSDVVG